MGWGEVGWRRRRRRLAHFVLSLDITAHSTCIATRMWIVCSYTTRTVITLQQSTTTIHTTIHTTIYTTTHHYTTTTHTTTHTTTPPRIGTLCEGASVHVQVMYVRRIVFVDRPRGATLWGPHVGTGRRQRERRGRLLVLKVPRVGAEPAWYVRVEPRKAITAVLKIHVPRITARRLVLDPDRVG